MLLATRMEISPPSLVSPKVTVPEPALKRRLTSSTRSSGPRLKKVTRRVSVSTMRASRSSHSTVSSKAP